MKRCDCGTCEFCVGVLGVYGCVVHGHSVENLNDYCDQYQCVDCGGNPCCCEDDEEGGFVIMCRACYSEDVLIKPETYHDENDNLCIHCSLVCRDCGNSDAI